MSSIEAISKELFGTLICGILDDAPNFNNTSYRKTLASGDLIQKNESVSERFKLNVSKKIPDHFNKINQESKEVMEVLKNL